MQQSLLATGNGFSQLELDAAAFKNVPDDSIDYAVMEKSGQVAVVPCNNSFNDIGSWTAFGDLATPDANGNRVAGEALLHNTRNTTIQSNGRLVGTVGVENLIIIDTPDAVLVANKASAQDVKHITPSSKPKDTRPTSCIARCTALGALIPFLKKATASRSSALKSNPVRP